MERVTPGVVPIDEAGSRLVVPDSVVDHETADAERPVEPSAASRFRRQFRRWLLAAAATVFAAGVLVALLTARWFIWPVSSHPRQADAIIVLGGGAGERYAKGMELLKAGVSDVIVFSTGLRRNRYREMDNVWDLCDAGSTKFKLYCVVASPDSTEGEAETVNRLAVEHGWKSLALVTSDHHMVRASVWFNRCFDGKVYRIVATAPTTKHNVTHEWAGLVQALVLDRSCSD